MRPRKMAMCHTDRFVHGYGLCAPCYRRQRKKDLPESGIISTDQKIKYAVAANKRYVRIKDTTEFKEKRADSHLMPRYGMTRKKKNERIEFQKGKCAICHKVMTRPHVDHCHQSGVFRGILCFKCNVGLGSFDDSIENLKSAIRYLQFAYDIHREYASEYYMRK